MPVDLNYFIIKSYLSSDDGDFQNEVTYGTAIPYLKKKHPNFDPQLILYYALKDIRQANINGVINSSSIQIFAEKYEEGCMVQKYFLLETEYDAFSQSHTVLERDFNKFLNRCNIEYDNFKEYCLNKNLDLDNLDV